MLSLDQIIRAVILARALLTGDAGTLRDEKVAFRHAAAALTAAGDDLDPALLLAVARAETAYDPASVSRVSLVTGKRVTSSRNHDRHRGPYFCGVMQTRANMSYRACVRQRDLGRGYDLGARELRNWLRRSRGDVRRALAGHCCGNAGFRRCRGRCRRYVDKVERRWKELRK